MGSLTRDALITAGMGKAGNLSTTVKARIEVEFQAWLDRQYSAWSWPFLKKRAVGLSLSAGTTSLTVGNGSGGVTREIIKLVSPVLFYTSDRTTRGKAPIVQASGDDSVEWDETLQDSTLWRGSPAQFKARHGTTRGSWDLVPMPFPDKALLLAIDYFERPATLTGAVVPIYPEDSTMISAIAALTLVDQKGADHAASQALLEETGALAARDRASHGAVPGENDVIPLSSAVFL